MIYVTRLNHTTMVLNSDLIEQVEMTPDTVISLTNGQKIMVLESSDEVVERVVTFRRSIASGCSTPGQAEVPPRSRSSIRQRMSLPAISRPSLMRAIDQGANIIKFLSACASRHAPALRSPVSA